MIHMRETKKRTPLKTGVRFSCKAAADPQNGAPRQ